MKTVVHLSDLHFGRIDQPRIAPLLETIKSIKPEMVVISGDLTQRATKKEFAEAKAFLDSLSLPIFTVPGNHDIPLYHIFRRLFTPFNYYKNFISSDLAPFYVDDEIALIGINSARSIAVSSGRINKAQIEKIEKIVEDIPEDIVRIAVCHHPFELPVLSPTHHKHTHKIIGRSKMAMERLAKLKIDIFLSGHLHLHYISETTERYKIKNYNALLVQAGTAISKRIRSKPVSFNVLRVERGKVEIDHFEGIKENSGYTKLNTEVFKFEKNGWKKDK
jgi:3',5'-cyclic AMP phosphodiesterase CpdA